MQAMQLHWKQRPSELSLIGDGRRRSVKARLIVRIVIRPPKGTFSYLRDILAATLAF